jgi:formate hydrogenlyase subunit 3/multisubunit Na+/H+ antiporter MnhD subunit
MLSVLGLMGFPITPAFVGVELLFANLNTNQYLALALLSLFFMLNGLAMMRMYARIFLGPHIKTYHETARKSS